MESSQASWEDARRCPKCQQGGVETATNPGPNGSTVKTLTCGNERCQWFNTSWVVQINPDGSIPIREEAEKLFTPLPGGGVQERTVAQIRRELQASTEEGGGEVRGR